MSLIGFVGRLPWASLPRPRLWPMRTQLAAACRQVLYPQWLIRTGCVVASPFPHISGAISPPIDWAVGRGSGVRRRMEDGLDRFGGDLLHRGDDLVETSAIGEPVGITFGLGGG